MNPIFDLFGSNALFVMSAFCAVGYLMGSGRYDALDTEMAPALRRSHICMAFVSFILVIEVMWRRLVVVPADDEFRTQAMLIFFSYLTSRFIAFGMSPSFDKHYASLKNVLLTFLRVGLCSIVLILMSCLDLPYMARVALLIFAAVWYVADTALLVGYVYRSYLINRRAYDEFYAEDYDRFLLWTPTVFGLLQLYGICWLPMSYTPFWTQSIYTFIGAALWFYVFICYERHMIFFRYRNSSRVVSIPQPEEPTIPDASYPFPTQGEISDQEMTDRYAYFVATLSRWIENKGYTSPDLTIEELARSINTNRTYLSTFINLHYGMPFRQWIAQLRIAEAKRLLADPNLREQDIVERTGYCTLQSFIRNFTLVAGMSPSAYRRSLSERK